MSTDTHQPEHPTPPGLRRALARVVDDRRGLDAAEKRQLISALVVEVSAFLAELHAQVERQRPVIEAAEALRADVGDLPWVPGTPLARLVDALAAARRAAPVGPAEPADDTVPTRPSGPPAWWTPRLRACIEEWPECGEGEYHSSCCRFPKSCSCTVYDPDRLGPDALEEWPSPADDTSREAQP